MSDDGAVKGVDAPVLSESERKLAGQAQNAFEAGSYGECLSHLSRLRECRPADYKVLHNIAVAKYYHSGLTQTNDFVQALSDLKSQLGASINDGSEVEKRVILFNLATVHFQLQEFEVATKIAERLLPRVDLFSDSFSRSVYFLLCDLYLLTSETSKAFWLLSKIEKYLAAQNNPNPQSSHGNTTSKAEKNQHGERERASNPLGDRELYRLCQLKFRLFLMKRVAKKLCKREISNMMATSQGSSQGALFMKSYFEFSSQKYVKAARLLCECSQLSASVGEEFSLRRANASAMGASIAYHDDLFYNNMGCIYSRMQRHHVAAFYCQQALQLNCEQLSKAATEHGPACLATLDIYHRHRQLLYNTGVELLFAGQPAAAFENLIAASQVFYSSPLLWLRLAEACVVVHRRDTEEQQSKPSLISSTVGSGSHHKLIVTSVAEQTGRRTETAAIPALTLEFADLCLKNSHLLLSESALRLSRARADSSSSSPSRPSSSPSLHGHDNGVDGSATGGSNGVGGSDDRRNPSLDACPPSSGHRFPYHAVDIVPLKSSVLLCGAYVSLCLGDFVVALRRAQELLKVPGLPGLFRCHGSMYAAEALVELSRVEEAVAVLSPEQLTDMNSFQSSGSESVTGASSSPSAAAGAQRPSNASSSGHFDYMSPISLAAGRASLYINLASVHSLNGDVDRAKRCLHHACAHLPSHELPPQTIQLAAFLELQSGNPSAALQILKRHHIPAMPKPAEASTLKAGGGGKRSRKS